MNTFEGVNVLGTYVPSDRISLCMYNENKIRVASKRVRYIGRTRGGNFVMVTEKETCWSESPRVWKQLTLRRTGSENLYPMTPELKAGQDLVERVLESMHS